MWWYTAIFLVRVSIGVIKQYDQKHVEEERVYFGLQVCTGHEPSLREVRTGPQRGQDPGGRD